MKENFLLGALIVAGLGIFLHGVRQAQHGPHVVNLYVAGTLRGSMTVTNPAYVHFIGGEHGEAIRVTNYYWRVWKIFR